MFLHVKYSVLNRFSYLLVGPGNNMPTCRLVLMLHTLSFYNWDFYWEIVDFYTI